MGNKKEDVSFIQHFLNVGIGTFINLLLGFISTPLITRIADPSEYGQLSIFNAYADIAPSTVFLISMLVPLIPGGNLYYTMSHLVLGESAQFNIYLRLVLWEASSIALGVMAVVSVVHLMQQMVSYRKKKTEIFPQ